MATQDQALEQKQAPLWWASVVTSAIGVAVSGYSLFHHLKLKAEGKTDASCNINSTISCDAVASSQYSEIFGIPLGVFGIGFFLALAIFAVTIVTNHKTKKENLPTFFVMVASGVVASIILGVLSVGFIGKVCLVCFVIYGLCLANAGLAFTLFRSGVKPGFDVKALGNGILSAVILLAVVIAGFNFLKPQAQLPPELQDTPGKIDRPRTLAVSSQFHDIPLNRTAYSGLGEDYRLGSDDAKIIVTEFADYMCPGCADAKKLLDELHRDMGKEVLIVFKNFPLSNKCNPSMQSDMHPFSCDIARLARCSGQYGKFWEYHRLAFDEQRSASTENAKSWARRVGLTDPQIESCLASADILAKIQDDVAIANRIGVDSTPSIFINGRKYLGGRTVNELRDAIRSL